MSSIPRHEPVLLEATLGLLAPERGGLFVDCTLGLGGHAEALLRRAPEARLLGIDRDPDALHRAARRLAPFESRTRFENARFSELERVLRGERIDGGILADLGVSSMQLDQGERGFSFQHDGPLDMRMGRGEVTAADIVNEYPEEELRRVFKDYGEERMARRVARELVRRRDQQPLETTSDLREAVHRAKGRTREGRIDSATRVFQALRLEVNRELTELEELLDQAVRLLDQEGRLVIISYHSLEDRIVKHRLRDWSQGEKDPVTGRPREETQLLELLTRRAISADSEEIESNPRARSARLRAARRL